MDDKLYYVEGPQGQVLGPMTMIQILEGIAAGAILESARICGVGEADWINLSDVAYTRHEEPETAAAPAPAPPSVAAPTREATLPPEETPANLAEEEPEGVEMSIADLAPAMFGPETEAQDAPPDSPSFATPEALPMSALPYESASEGASDFEVPVYAETGAPAPTNDFAIDDAQEPARGGRARWLVPILAGLGVPALFGIYLLASGTLPLPGGDDKLAQDTATTPAIPEMPPVAASTQGPSAEAWDGLHGEAGMNPNASGAAPGAARDEAASSPAGSSEPISLRFDTPEATAPATGTPQAPLDAAIEELSHLDASAPAPVIERRAEPEPPATFERVAEKTPAPAAKAPSRVLETPAAVPTPVPQRAVSQLAGPLNGIRSSLASSDYRSARAAVESARKDLASDPEARANLDLWNAICDFEEGDLVDALAKFEKLNRSASYEASGFGAGAVPNWIARVHLSSGDVRSAVGVLDEVGGEDPDEYAWARVWEGAALAALGMDELAERTWGRLSGDVGARVTPAGVPSVRTAQFLSGAISEKQYRDAIGASSGWTNDMHYFLGLAARRANNPDLAREHFRRAMTTSQGKEFPYHLAEAEISGEGLTGGW